MTTKPAQPQQPVDLGHLTVRPDDAGPAEIRFLFQQQEKRMGGALGVSVAVHVGVAGLILLLGYLLPPQVYESVLPDRLSDQIVWLTEPGPGGGGGGGGNRMPDPPKKAELPGTEKITVPAVKPPAPTPEPPKPEPPPLEQQVNIPAQTIAAADTTSPGVIESAPTPTPSQGSGAGGGAGTGSGTGVGQGQGSGLGQGVGGGTGGGLYKPGNGVTEPRLLSSVRPNYTAEAMRARIQGTVELEGVVLPDGTVGDVRVVRSLGSAFGLDEEAIKAAKRFRFAPSTRMGEPVAVLVRFEIEFALR